MSLVDRLGVREAVVVLPWVEHQSIHRYLSHSKIGLVPLQPTVKFRRNIPIKLFEYMACGLPVLGADSTSVVPYVRESGAGRLYDSTSFEALARGVVTMLGDVVALRRMGENGRKAVREKWNWSKMEDRLLAVYDELSAVGTGREKGSTHSSSRATPSQ
jgi:glycosyltransferase involved in cell wall biosynthesis